VRQFLQSAILTSPGYAPGTIAIGKLFIMFILCRYFVIFRDKPSVISLHAEFNYSLFFFSVLLCVCVRVLCLFYSVCQFSFFCVLWAKLPEIKLMMMMINQPHLEVLCRSRARINAVNLGIRKFCKNRARDPPLRGSYSGKNPNFISFGGRKPTPLADQGEI